MNGRHVVAVFAGGALGSLARVLVAWPFIAGSGPAWPGTLAANALGALAMGMCAARLGSALEQRITLHWHFTVTGFLGGFTTFSLFSLEAVHLLVLGEIVPAIGYIAGSALVWLGAVALGWVLARPRTG